MTNEIAEVKNINPNTSDTIGKLTEALSKAQGEFDHAKKEVKNEFFKSKYADLASVIDAAKTPLTKNGLAVTQTTRISDNDKVILVTILSHSSGEWVRSEYPINPVKQDPQGMGSAMTYARRYSYSAITGIASDDDDGNAASGNNSKIATTSKPDFKPETAVARNKRYNAVKEALEKSDDPAATWHDNATEIEEFRESLGIDYHQQLINAGAKRKQELQAKADFAERK